MNAQSLAQELPAAPVQRLAEELPVASVQSKPSNPRKPVQDKVTKPRAPGQRIPSRTRIEILTLYNHAGWGYRKISKELNVPRSTVQHIVQNPATPPPPRGRPPKSTILIRDRLVDTATIDIFHRCLDYDDI